MFNESRSALGFGGELVPAIAGGFANVALLSTLGAPLVPRAEHFVGRGRLCFRLFRLETHQANLIGLRLGTLRVNSRG